MSAPAQVLTPRADNPPANNAPADAPPALPGGYVDLTSGEGVELDLRVAGVGSRVVAALLDLMVAYGAYLVLSIAVVLGAHQLDPAAVAAVLVTVLVLAFAGYPIVAEWLFGRTLGKAALGLRVVRTDGGPIGFRQALVRGLSGLLIERAGLIYPIGTAVAVITMTFGARSQRLGDLMAGTVVASERAGANAVTPLPRFGVPPALLPWAATVDLRGISDGLAAVLRDFVSRASGLTPVARARLEQELLPPVLAALAPWPPPGTPIPIIFSTVLAERRRRAEALGRPV